MVAMSDSIGSPSATGSSASGTAQDMGRVNPHCEAQSTDCRTDCFTMRKIVAHLFGRNKVCTAQIPEHCWVEWCRKHYQRLRHRMLEQGWIFLQINCLRTQLGRMEEWGQVQSWTIILQHKFQEELDREVATQKPQDVGGLRNSTKTVINSKEDYAKTHAKTSPNRFLHLFLGKKKSFHDVYAVIDAVEKAANEGQLTSFPPLQFLPLIDATLHPPPPIARPRKQRKPKVFKNQVHNNLSNNDSNLNTLADGDITKSGEFSASGHPSAALKSLLSPHSAGEQVAAEPLSLALVTTRPAAMTVSEHELRYTIIDQSEARTASAVVNKNIDPEIVNGNSLPVTQQSTSYNVTRKQAAGQTSPLSILSTSQGRVGAFADGMKGFVVDKPEDEDYATIFLRLIAEGKKSGMASNILQAAQSSVRHERGFAIENSSGEIGSSISADNKYNANLTLPPAAGPPPKIKTPPPGSRSVIDKKYGLIGYKTAKPKSANIQPSPSRRPHLHSRISQDKTPPAPASTEPMNENPPIKFDLSYPMDPSRTYKPAPNQFTRQIEAQSTAVEIECEQTAPLGYHSSADKKPGNNFDTLGWTPIMNAQTAKLPNAMSIGKLGSIADSYSIPSKRALALDCDNTSTNIANTIANSEGLLVLAQSSGALNTNNGDCNTDQSPSAILAGSTVSSLKPSSSSSEMTGRSSTNTRGKKRLLGNHLEERSLLNDSQPLSKRRMRVKVSLVDRRSSGVL